MGASIPHSGAWQHTATAGVVALLVVTAVVVSVAVRWSEGDDGYTRAELATVLDEVPLPDGLVLDSERSDGFTPGVLADRRISVHRRYDDLEDRPDLLAEVRTALELGDVEHESGGAVVLVAPRDDVAVTIRVDDGDLDVTAFADG
jgi:hypothetical protein